MDSNNITTVSQSESGLFLGSVQKGARCDRRRCAPQEREKEGGKDEERERELSRLPLRLLYIWTAKRARKQSFLRGHEDAGCNVRGHRLCSGGLVGSWVSGAYETRQT